MLALQTQHMIMESSASIIPFEIEETILDFLAEDDNYQSVLNTCSLVCQAFLPICRKHIYKSIALNLIFRKERRTFLTLKALERLLSERTEIADYIRNLDYNVQEEDLAYPSTLESLKQISRLESLRVSSPPTTRLDWSNNPIRSTLLHLLHLPTITYFSSSRMGNFVVSDLLPCVNLKHLELSYTIGAISNTFPAALPEQQIRLHEFSTSDGNDDIIMKLCKTRRPDGKLVIDFISLSKVKVELYFTDDPEALLELFRQCKSLSHVSILFVNPVKASLASLLRPCMQTLKHITVDIGVDDNPLSVELEDMRMKNDIETLHITYQVRFGGYRCCNGYEWGRLDEVLTSSGWDALKRVSLRVQNYPKIDDSIKDEALRQLLQARFPQLSSSKSVAFNFDVIG